MSDLESLKKVSDTVLSELKADDVLKQKILNKAVSTSVGRKRSTGLLRAIPALCCSLAIVISAAVLVPGILSSKETANEPIIQTFAAGNSDPDIQGELKASGTGLKNNGLSITSGSLSNDDIWESVNQNPAIIRINGYFYRMLAFPGTVSGSGIGREIGTVGIHSEDFTDGNMVISNCIEAGEKIYASKGNGSAWIIAKYQNKNRLFQRVSYNGIARASGESIRDVAPIDDQIISVQLSGHEPITDPSKVNALMTSLGNYAAYDGNSLINSQQYLVLTNSDGWIYVFNIKGNRLSSCGTWTCPEFFEQYSSLE